MLIGNMLGDGDFFLDGLDLLLGFLNVVILENPVRKPGDFFLGLVCNSIDLAHDHVALLIGPVLCFLDLILNRSFSLEFERITLLLQNIDNPSGL